MSDTHINAYFGDVDEKLKALLAAQADYEAAKQRLEIKKKEVGYEEPKAEETPAPKADEPTEADVEPKKSLFSKK